MPTTYPPTGARKTKLSGDILIGAAATSQTATIAAWDVGKCDLRLLGYRANSGSGLSASDYPKLTHTNSTTITADRLNSGSGVQVVVSWELTQHY